MFAGPLGGVRSGTTLTHNVQEILARRGIEPIRWHALRRVFAAILQDQGVPLPHIRDLLSHSQIQVTERYAYVMPESLKDAMSAVDGGLSGVSLGVLESEFGYDSGATASRGDVRAWMSRRPHRCGGVEGPVPTE